MVRRRENLTLSVSTPALREVKTAATTPVSSQRPKQRLTKQLSMLETPRDVAWERRKRQMIMIQEKKMLHKGGVSDNLCEEKKLTDEDLNELKGSIELGFGFNEEAGQKLCNTLPALDLYLAVNRQIMSPLPSPSRSLSSSASASALLMNIPCSPKKTDSDSLKIVCPGDNPQQVKQRLRHWAQAVACSVMQTY